EANPFIRDYLDDLCGPEGLPVRSPILRVTQIDAPVLLIHGENDENVPVAQTVAMAESLKSHGKDVESLIVPSGTHFFSEQQNARAGVRWSDFWPRHPPGSGWSMRVSEAIKSRHSMRTFKPDPVSREDVEWIVTTASRAASNGNLQPWKLYITMGKARERLSTAVLKAMDEGDMGPGAEYAVYPKEFTPLYDARRKLVGKQL